MIPPLRTSTRRIAYAIALSALVHGLMLWLPHIKLPSFKEQLPPLVAKLEPLPNIPSPPPKKRKPKPATLPAPPAEIPAPLPASAVADAEPLPASAPVATDTAEQAPAMEATDLSTTVAHPLLPKHAQLTFAVRRGTDGFKVGEVQHRLDITDGRYTLQSSAQTTGLARLFKSYSLNQSSNGTVSVQGLRPENFSEEKNDSGDVETLTATFDWEEHILNFSEGGDSPLREFTQDSLSILYQLSQIPLAGELFLVSISNGKKLDDYMLEISSDETISTAMGELPAVHLRKLRKSGEAGLEIWLAREYRLLPVKIQYFEPDGTVTATISITDIRVSDE